MFQNVHASFDPTGKTIDECFHSRLPDNLYYSHYDLSRIYTAFTPEDWRRYLKSEDRFIMNQINSITEAQSREALSRLGSGELKPGDVTAIKQLLDRSEQLNSQSQDKRTFVVMQFDSTSTTQPQTAAQKSSAYVQENYENVNRFYNLTSKNETDRLQFDRREADGEIVRNKDGTLHFPKIHLVSDLDSAYLRLFNPDNIHVKELPVFENDGGDWQ